VIVINTLNIAMIDINAMDLKYPLHDKIKKYTDKSPLYLSYDNEMQVLQFRRIIEACLCVGRWNGFMPLIS